MRPVSIIIPAFNEEALLPRTLESVKEALLATGIEAEVIVVDNNSTDRTGDVARDLGARVVFEPVNQIARARNAGGKAASGEFLVFVDADTTLPGETLRQALVALESGTCCVGGALIAGDREWKGFSAWLVKMWTQISRESQFAAGSFVFCLRDGFLEVGGFDESVYAGEEIWFAKRMKRWGKRRGLGFHLVEDPPVITSARKGEMFGSGQLFLQFLIVVLFPWATRSRRMCWVWYHRPAPERPS